LKVPARFRSATARCDTTAFVRDGGAGSTGYGVRQIWRGLPRGNPILNLRHINRAETEWGERSPNSVNREERQLAGVGLCLVVEV
jgi:hypothetical protein